MLKEMKLLIQELQFYCEAYYNKNQSLISDYEYDKKYDRLKYLEENTGVVLANSPTVRVGAEVVSRLKKVEHNHPMLSLDKTKSIEDVRKFIGDRESLAMLKMDGLTVTLTYRDGKLVGAETRGNGSVGEDIFHNAKHFSNIPLEIGCKNEFIVDGEAIIDLNTFQKINEPLIKRAREEGIRRGLSGSELESYINDNSYKNARNLAAGSVRQLDSGVSKERNIRFIAWKSIKGIDEDSFCGRLDMLSSYGFEIVPYIQVAKTDIESAVGYLKGVAKEEHYPIDGIVFSYDSVSYGESLGATTHHLRSQYAYKFYDCEQETILRDVEWSLGRTGVLTPVAIFNPVDIEGTTVERASLHNLSIFKSFELGIGDSILVYKANMIIPQISENLTRSGSCTIPELCPVCGSTTDVTFENDTENLVCSNPNCEGKILNRITNFVSRQGMNINGFSKKSIDKLISVGVLGDFTDIYRLSDKKAILMTLDGFGKKKVNTLLEEIEKSKEVSLENFLCALGIPGLGSSKCKKLSEIFGGSYAKLAEAIKANYDFSGIEDFGPVINKKIYDFWTKNAEMIAELSEMMIWKEKGKTGQKLEGMIFVITGKLLTISRKELKEKIEAEGGKVLSNVTTNTNFLINNEIESQSTKNVNAKRLGIPIITEEKFFKKIF